MSVRSLRFQGELEMFQANSPQWDKIAVGHLITEAGLCLAWQTPWPPPHVGQSAHTVSIPQVPAPGTESHRESKA